MNTEQGSYFFALAQEWWAAAVLRVRGVPEGDPALGVWREAAWCHLLVARGHYAAVVMRLRAVVLDVTGVPPMVPATVPVAVDETVDAAADLFAPLRSAVSARYPTAFGHPAAA